MGKTKEEKAKAKKGKDIASRNSSSSRRGLEQTVARADPSGSTADGHDGGYTPSPHGVPRTSLFCSAYRVPCKILLAYQILCARLLASNMSHMHVEMP